MTNTFRYDKYIPLRCRVGSVPGVRDVGIAACVVGSRLTPVSRSGCGLTATGRPAFVRGWGCRPGTGPSRPCRPRHRRGRTSAVRHCSSTPRSSAAGDSFLPDPGLTQRAHTSAGSSCPGCRGSSASPAACVGKRFGPDGWIGTTGAWCRWPIRSGTAPNSA